MQLAYIPQQKKVEAVKKAPSPTNVQQLRSFLGLLHYYDKFIPNMASLLHPLNKLLQKGHKWEWSSICDKSFLQAKDMLSSAKVLVHYNPTHPICLAGDASAYGMGTVITYVYPDGSERLIAYASRTFSASEKNYAQVEKEALSLIFGILSFTNIYMGDISLYLLTTSTLLL